MDNTEFLKLLTDDVIRMKAKESKLLDECAIIDQENIGIEQKINCLETIINEMTFISAELVQLDEKREKSKRKLLELKTNLLLLSEKTKSISKSVHELHGDDGISRSHKDIIYQISSDIVEAISFTISECFESSTLTTNADKLKDLIIKTNDSINELILTGIMKENVVDHINRQSIVTSVLL